MTAPRYVEYFDAQARLGKSFLHPGAREATATLLTLLPEKWPAGARVVEIGCGIGETAACLLERFPACSYTGLDASPDMLERAAIRLKPFGAAVQLIHRNLRVEKELPFPSGSIDVIISESVLAILDQPAVLYECFRVLNEVGSLAWNDRIWSEKSTPADRQRINSMSERLYGFHAAPLSPATAAEWQEVCREIGFKNVSAAQIHAPGNGAGAKEKRSRLVHMLRHPLDAFVDIQDRVIGRRHAADWALMENWIFIARK